MNYRDIVVGVDGSPQALHAAQWAAHEAARRKARLRLVHVCLLLQAYEEAPETTRTSYLGELHALGHGWLDRAAGTARDAEHGLEIESAVLDGSITRTLLAESGTAAMLVLGARGLGGFR